MIPGFTSTGSKRPDLLFGRSDTAPAQMIRSHGCRLWDVGGREYVDLMMALGAVSLGYAHPRVVEATERAVRDGGVGSLAPRLEAVVAEQLGAIVPLMESVRFLKTGAEAVAAGVRIARVATGRPHIVAAGYHGWLDGLTDAEGVPEAVRALRTDVPFNDAEALIAACDRPDVAAVLIEPVVDGPPTQQWIDAIRNIKDRTGAIVILDEIKTGLRLGLTGAMGRWNYPADVLVLGKALGNGFPIAAVGGSRKLMEAATRTWISSTLATEFVSLAAAEAVLEVFRTDAVADRLALAGGRLFLGLEEVAHAAPHIVESVRGIPEFCYLQFTDVRTGSKVAERCAAHGLLFKRDAYNFVSLAHDDQTIRESLACIGSVVEEIAWG